MCEDFEIKSFSNRKPTNMSEENGIAHKEILNYFEYNGNRYKSGTRFRFSGQCCLRDSKGIYNLKNQLCRFGSCKKSDITTYCFCADSQWYEVSQEAFFNGIVCIVENVEEKKVSEVPLERKPSYFETKEGVLLIVFTLVVLMCAFPFLGVPLFLIFIFTKK